MPFRVTSKGNWERTEEHLKRLQSGELFSVIDRFGPIGVEALASATPKDSGLTAESWSYEVIHKRGYHAIRWFNSNSENGQQVAILLQYGHGTGTGGYVEGQDYINPAIRPIFDQIDAEMRKVVTK